MTDDLEAELCDALARGHLSLAELAGLSGRELEALYALGLAWLDAGREEDAVTHFGGLVSLFPFDARYVRAYGIALQRTGRYAAARAAYGLALTMEPGHPPTTCYLGEVLLYLGEPEAGREALRRAEKDATCGARATRLLEVLAAVDAAGGSTRVGEPEPLEEPETVTADFSLRDARPLPLAGSRLARPARRERSSTALMARPLVGVRAEVTATSVSDDERTETQPREARPQEREITHTAIIRRGHGAPLIDED